MARVAYFSFHICWRRNFTRFFGHVNSFRVQQIWIAIGVNCVTSMHLYSFLDTVGFLEWSSDALKLVKSTLINIKNRLTRLNSVWIVLSTICRTSVFTHKKITNACSLYSYEDSLRVLAHHFEFAYTTWASEMSKNLIMIHQFWKDWKYKNESVVRFGCILCICHIKSMYCLVRIIFALVYS